MHTVRLFVFFVSTQLLVLSAFAQTGKNITAVKEPGNLSYIDPRVGNVGQLLEPTRPTVQLPNQMIRMYPLRKDYIDDEIAGFPLIIVSHRMGEAFSIKPWCKEVRTDSWKKKQAYDHDLEVTRPWYYSTYLLDDEATVEFVPGKKTGIYRFTFPETAEKSLLLGNL